MGGTIPAMTAPAERAQAARSSPQSRTGSPLHEVTSLVVEPFLHVGDSRVASPLTGREIAAGEPGFTELLALLQGSAELGALPSGSVRLLLDGGWLVESSPRLDTRFHLKYVSLESHTACNQSCYFCPVSIAPRDDHFMPTELYRSIVDQLASYRATIEAVFMISYNEPTLDKRFVDLVGVLRAAGLPPAVLTNGTGLPPPRVDALLEMGGLRYLSINLSTLDRERYARDRGGDHLDLVLRNLAYMKELPLAEEMAIVVLGQGDDVHRRDFEEIRARFAGSRFTVNFHEVMDRAGYLQVGLKASGAGKRLRGCENIGSRPLQHLHVTPHGKAVFCCEDYDEYHVIGDLRSETVAEVLAGAEIAKLRRWSYGLEEAPADFICRKCVFARLEA